MDPVLTPAVIAVLGLIVPIIVSTLKSETMPDWVKQSIVILVCLGAGVASVLTGVAFSELTIPLIIGHASAIFVVAQSVYRLYFKSTGLNEKLTKLIWG